MYTKEELIGEMFKYNKNYLNREETNESFGEIEDTIECATNQVEYLLGLIVKHCENCTYETIQENKFKVFECEKCKNSN